MTKIVTVPVHIDTEDLHAESWVPAETVAGWVALGWVEGRLPELAEAADVAHAEQIAAAREAADLWAAEHPAPETLEQRRLVDEVAPAESPSDIAPPAPESEIAGRRNRGTGVPVPTGTNPTTPEEG